MHFSLASFVAVAAATLVIAQPRAWSGRSSNPDNSVTEDAAWDASAPLTNAERFKHNMPPLKPKAHRRADSHRGGLEMGTRVRAAPRSASSPVPPVAQKCNIKVTSVGGTILGYISPTWNSNGAYGQFQSIQTGALELSFSYSPDVAGYINILATNSPTPSYLGAIAGPSSPSGNLGVGRSNYVFLGGSLQGPPGPPTRGPILFGASAGVLAYYESAIWTYDPTTKAITAQWTSSSGTLPVTRIVYGSGQSLVLTGDAVAYQNAYGASSEVRLTCVPSA